MKILLILPLLLLSVTAHCEKLVPSMADPALATAREEAFIPWSEPEQSSTYWKELSKKNVPIYYERKHGNLSRDIYIPNPGIGYWVLAGLTEEQLFKTHKEKLKIGDTLVSASVYTDENGHNIYWALWAPKERAYLLTDKMKELGVTQARIEYSPLDKFEAWTLTLKPFSPAITWGSLGLNAILILSLLAVSLRRKSSSPGFSPNDGNG